MFTRALSRNRYSSAGAGRRSDSARPERRMEITFAASMRESARLTREIGRVRSLNIARAPSVTQRSIPLLCIGTLSPVEARSRNNSMVIYKRFTEDN